MKSIDGDLMEWYKPVIRSIISAIIITIILGLIQLGITSLGVGWFALLPSQTVGVSFWGFPYGWLKRLVYPNASFEIVSLYLLYDIIAWFIISFVIMLLKRR